MPAITKAKKDIIRRHYITGEVNVQHIAEKLELRQATVRSYLNDFRILDQQHPDKLQDYDFYIGKEKIFKSSPWYLNFLSVMPGLVLAEPGPVLIAEDLYQKYHSLFPEEFSKPRFYHVFKRWFEANENELCAAKLKSKFTSDELAILRRWRKGNDHRLWQVSVLLMTTYTYNSMSKLGYRIECAYATMLIWLRTYQREGLAALSRPGNKKPICRERREAIEKRMDEVVHLVRQSPKLYGFDKISWTITDLAYAYSKVSGKDISFSTVGCYLRKRGIRFKRSREVIVSHDPRFLEKYDHIRHILAGLGRNEKFFSIDEYGPKSVRPKGGRQLVRKGELPVYYKVDKSKGWFICTCALELSTNQLTWFYSLKKDTSEMIRLIDVLTLQYQNQERLYLSWDAASWHDSQQLRDYLAEINEPEYREKLKTPRIELVPLPSRTPHLNVIESVFSGLAKSVIHNSDYQSVDECTAAIDRYFNRRNQHFLRYPKRAGQKIWGKEKVKPVFDKANICRHLG
ncbi:IS630 family transposase [Mucilaginibacter aquaedulcis]|uniref:IS630 family transposase n=1 Tax=Mucilaginibacter aquaedulcis TaxID=1187081 RepID=UPI0025B477A7|nr:IS630 family transposase [Mucilaginibacter aquaedulcis]MDN3548823.1 IS630 family transposase [Mucilaginibacter aquaedulcis]